MLVPAPASELLQPGARFQDRYEIVNEVGAGSFGRVYRARQLSTQQDVALKILRVQQGGRADDVASQRQRFRREMQVCAALSHPNIVRLIDSGEVDDVAEGLLYAVFEYVPGVTLRHVLELEGRLDDAETLHLMTQVLDALACAHARGIVHRDLKPENIMVTRTGLRRNATVLDFGLGGFVAGALPDTARLTITGELLGTPSYAAPEQLRGEPVSPRADLYSWGLIFLECLSGEIVVSARTPHETLMLQLGPTPIAIPSMLREQRLGRLLLAVTTKDVAARDISEQSLLEALEAIQRSHTGPSAESRPAAVEGERRHVTVVSLATVATRADGGPVELDELDHLVQAQERLYDRIVRESGHALARGDSGESYVVFGFPKAREHDARRAVRMALLIAERARAATAEHAARGLVVGVRIGVHSGVGIVRVRHRTPDSEPWVGVVGTPTAIAARVARDAEVNDVLVTADTRALLRGEIECEAVGEVSVPDSTGTIAVWRVVRELPPGALETIVRAEEAPLVGRTGELGQLVELWHRAESGELAVALLQGEAGIGKSRLIRELRRQVPQPATVVTRCSPEGGGTPLGPLVAWLRPQAAGLPALLADHGFDPAATWPLFADLLDVRRGDDYEPLRLSPDRQKELTLAAVADLIVRMALRRPLLFVLEDLHWADPTTGELIAVLLDRARATYFSGGDDAERGGLVLLFSARAEYTASWTAQDVTVLPMGRLSRRDVAAIVNACRPRGAEVPPEIMNRIVERTDGVPLFVEELSHAIDLADERGIPSTLRELLSARLDALSTSAHETAQFAASVGREVPYPVLRAVVPKDEWMLRQDLMELVDARLLFARRTEEEAYVFRHALVRDAAYESMVRVTRERVHHAIANGLTVHLPSLGDRQPERLAYHFERAGDLGPAAAYWFRAGDRAFRRAAYVEAIQHLEQSLAVLERMPDGPERAQQEIESLTVLGSVFLYTTGHSHPRGREVMSRARALSDERGVELSISIVARLAGTHVIQGNREAMAALLPRCERLLESPEPVRELTGIIVLALAAFWGGEHRRAAALFERGVPIYRGDAYRAHADAQGWDPGIYVPLYTAWNLALLGEPEERAAPALAAAASSFDPQANALVSVFAMAAAHLRGDTDAARTHATQAIQISGEQRFLGLLAFGFCGYGLALVRAGAHAEGLAQIVQGTEMLRGGGAATPYAYYRTYVAEAHLTMGDVDAGLAVTRDALDRCQRELATVHEPELLRIEGELLRRAGNTADAEARLRQAVALAQAREARAWEVRAAVSLARLLRDTGREQEGRTVLQPVVDGWPPGAMMPDRDEATRMLEPVA